MFQPHHLIQNTRVGEVLHVFGKDRAQELCAHGVRAFLEELAVKNTDAALSQNILGELPGNTWE